MKFPNKRKFQPITINNLSDIDFKDFMKVYKNCTVKPYSLLVNDTTFPSENSLRFRKSILNI